MHANRLSYCVLFFSLLSILAVVSSCKKKQAKENLPVQDSLAHKPTPSDSTFYIGRMDYFDNTQEFYTTLYFNVSGPDQPYDYLSQQTDSVILENEEIRRNRVPESKAREHLNLVGLDTVVLYNHQNERVGKAVLRRIELYEDPIEGKYIGVYKTLEMNGPAGEVHFAMTSTNEDPTTPLTYKEHADNELDQLLIRKLDIRSDSILAIKHIRITPLNATYSLVNLPDKSYLLDVGNDVTIMMSVDKVYWITGIVPVPIMVNEKPVLLADFAMPETDMMWSSVLVYDGQKYVVSNAGRIALPKQEPPL